MITDDDIKKLKTVFATKDDLKKEIEKATIGLVHWTELEEKLDERDKRIDLKLNRIITILDGLVGEVKNYREEQTITGERLVDHEDRLEVIETKLQITL